MKRQITRSLASLALATALLSGAGSAFAATPASVTPTFNALGDPTTPALPGLPGELPGLGSLPDPSALPNLGAPGDLPVDLGTLGLPTDPAAGAQIATGALELTGGALDAGAGVTSAVTGHTVPGQAVSSGLGIGSAVVNGVAVPIVRLTLP